MNVFISGGAKNGKSYYAQRIARQMAMPAGEAGVSGSETAPEKGGASGSGTTPEKAGVSGSETAPEKGASGKNGGPADHGRPLYYIATMIPHDEEDQARIRRHIRERAGWGFETLEQGTDLLDLLQTANGEASDRADALSPADRADSLSPADRADTLSPADRADSLNPADTSDPAEEATVVDPRGVFLLDSVTALLSNEMFREDGSVDHEAAERVAKDCTAFAKATGNTVFVSDYIYGDAERYESLTEEYRQGLARIDRELAAVCDRVIEVSAGIIEEWK